MPKATAKYDEQRKRVTPPHVDLQSLRIAVGITLDELCDRIGETTGTTPTRGAISAIENGHRGGSADLLAAIAIAYGLPPGAISTTYRPRLTSRRAAA
jgi:transcriptional regulator with XRE-family HTH domain